MKKIVALIVVLFVVGCIPLENDATRMVPKQGDQRIDQVVSGELVNEAVVEEVVVPKAVAASGIFHEITIENLKFFPPELNVGVGDEITWLNEDDVSHSIVMGDIVSPVLVSGGSFTHVFLERGTYAYSCGIHPMMTGTIVVS
ncbi:MAG: cupredoxin domain-containing protein [Nanoarchaeota archaeon]|nr:cupredoxin domain-containing protein [Nanoarchaeota archaeon]